MSDRTVYQILVVDTATSEAVDTYFTDENILDIQEALGNNISLYDTIEDLNEANSSSEIDEEEDEDDEDLFVDDEDEDDVEDEVKRGEN